jgi:ketosteroid isomerase-like protein
VTTPLELSQSYWNAECRRDLDAVMSHYHDDATHEDAGGLHRGHAEIRANYDEHM